MAGSTFAAYKQALVRKDGTAAAYLVSDVGLDYFENLRQCALACTAAHVRGRMDPISKFIVLSLRHRMDPEELANMDGRSVFAYGVKNWTGDTPSLELGDVDVEWAAATVVR